MKGCAVIKIEKRKSFMKKFRVSSCPLWIKRFSLGFSVSVAILFSQGAIANEARTLTLSEALAIAAEQNRDIEKAKEFFRKVDGRYLEERAAALPQVSLNGSAVMEKDESLRFFTGTADQQKRLTGEATLSQALFTWGQVSAGIRAAKMGLKTAEDQLRLFKQAAARDVTAAFYDILLAKELHALAAQNLEQKTRHLDEAKRKHEAGVATDYDVLAAQVAVDNARPEVIRTENQVRVAKDRLRFFLAIEESELEVNGELAVEPGPFPTFEEAAAVAKAKRPELEDIRHRVGINEELVKIAKAGNKPRLDFKGSYGWQKVEFDGADTDGTYWRAGLYLSFPIFDGFRTKGRVAQARSDVTSLQIEERKQIDAVALETRTAVNAVRESEEIMKSLSGTVTQAERLLFMAEKGYELGVKIRLEVDDAELNLLQAKGNLARAKRDYLVARTNLDWTMGVLE